MRRPWILAADLADDAGADMRPPGTGEDVPGHLLGEVVGLAAHGAGGLVFRHAVAAAHDDVDPGRQRDLLQPPGVGLEAAAGELDHGIAAEILHGVHLGNGHILQVHEVAADMLHPAVVDGVGVVEGDVRLRLVRLHHRRRAQIAEEMLVHERHAERGRLDQAGHGLNAALKTLSIHDGVGHDGAGSPPCYLWTGTAKAQVTMSDMTRPKASSNPATRSEGLPDCGLTVISNSRMSIMASRGRRTSFACRRTFTGRIAAPPKYSALESRSSVLSRKSAC